LFGVAIESLDPRRLLFSRWHSWTTIVKEMAGILKALSPLALSSLGALGDVPEQDGKGDQ